MNRINFCVGVNNFIVKDGKILLGLRKNVFGHDTWGLPGGHIEYNESIQQCAKRELYEETGLRCSKFDIIDVVSQYQAVSNNYLQIGVIAISPKGKIKVKEPEKCSRLEWFPLTKLPKNIFEYHRKNIKDLIKFLNK